LDEPAFGSNGACKVERLAEPSDGNGRCGCTRKGGTTRVERPGIARETSLIELHSLKNGPDVVQIALGLGRTSAYDAAYIAQAQQLDAELWTLDGPLARNALGRGLPVRLVQ